MDSNSENHQSNYKQPEIFLIRHGQSQFNKASSDCESKCDFPFVWENIKDYKPFIDGVKFNPKYLDCAITQKGIEQSQKAAEQFAKVNPDLVLVSPLNRTLMTCQHAMSKISKDTPIIVEPILTESFRSICGVSSSLKGKVERFPLFDFSPVLEEGDFWFINNLDSEIKKQYQKAVDQNADRSFEEKALAISELMKKEMIAQSYENIFRRAKEAKEMLKEKYSGKYKRIAVVTHANLIRAMFDRRKDKKKESSTGIPPNAQIIKTDLDQLLRQN